VCGGGGGGIADCKSSLGGFCGVMWAGPGELCGLARIPA
jgi:hypothetical protein